MTKDILKNESDYLWFKRFIEIETSNNQHPASPGIYPCIVCYNYKDIEGYGGVDYDWEYIYPHNFPSPE